LHPEFDPSVYEAAIRYFGLPASRAVYLDDGAAFVAHTAENARSLRRDAHDAYDYVIHDCFTGGSVPHELFTWEFWEDLRMILKADGVLAVNFAGALKSKATQAVVRTLIDAFPQCRAFTDAYGSHEISDGKELSNMVGFRKSRLVAIFRAHHRHPPCWANLGDILHRKQTGGLTRTRPLYRAILPPL